MKGIVNIEDARQLARRRLPRMIFEFVDGGAEDEIALRANRRAFEEVTFRPRVLVDVSRQEQTTTVLGTEVKLPVFLAPIGLTRLVSREGELAAARAAGKAGTVFVVSTASSFTIEEVAEVATGPLWFQLYLSQDREISTSLVQRAQASGYQALCLAVDMPVSGKRERDLRSGMTVPPRIRFRNVLDCAWRFGWLRDLLFGQRITLRNFLGHAEGDSAASLATFVNSKVLSPKATWDDLEWLRSLWKGPLVVKGILTAEDAQRAVDCGADGIVVSNHGGRQLDSAPATFAVLPEIVDAVGENTEVLLDGGVQRGADVVKALALGARACMVGRPYLWGLTVNGEAGVAQVLEIFREEIDRTLALIGRPRLSEVDRSAVRIGHSLPS